MTEADLAGRTTWRTDLAQWDGERVPVPLAQANLISSSCADGMHRPVIDLDFPCRLLPSTTPGHFHLYLDRALPWGDYADLLAALLKARLIEDGFYKMSMKRGASFVRPPGVAKEPYDLNSVGDHE